MSLSNKNQYFRLLQDNQFKEYVLKRNNRQTVKPFSKEPTLATVSKFSTENNASPFSYSE